MSGAPFRSRWAAWTPENSGECSTTEPAKPAKPGFEGFAGATPERFQKNEGGDDPSALTPYGKLERDGYLVVESSVVGGPVLFVLNASRVPADLQDLPSFGWDEIGHLLKLDRPAARQAIRDLLTVKRALGSGSRIAALTEDHGGPEGAPGPGAPPPPPLASEKPAPPLPPETADLFGEARP